MDEANLQIHFDECIEFIEESLKKNENILVHCAAGVSRSASIVIAYIMKTKKLKFEEAFNLVKSKRSIICPNRGFRSQLMDFEKSLNL